MPEVFFPTEVLPVGILYPALHHRFIRFIEGVLQVVQPDHQPDRDAGTALLRIQATELFFHRPPADLPRQPVQRVALIQYLLQSHPKKIITTTMFLLLWFHQNSPEINGYQP